MLHVYAHQTALTVKNPGDVAQLFTVPALAQWAHEHSGRGNIAMGLSP